MRSRQPRFRQPVLVKTIVLGLEDYFLGAIATLGHARQREHAVGSAWSLDPGMYGTLPAREPGGRPLDHGPQAVWSARNPQTLGDRLHGR